MISDRQEHNKILNRSSGSFSFIRNSNTTLQILLEPLIQYSNADFIDTGVIDLSIIPVGYNDANEITELRNVFPLKVKATVMDVNEEGMILVASSQEFSNIIDYEFVVNYLGFRIQRFVFINHIKSSISFFYF